ncbi:YfaP family protein [Rubrivirga sp. IMCC43871]|uniref:YfaP family protein n=1 Tax=Rubrivirga sp. IMCC43871 TaxID=3391575 RepID=UPI00398F9C73
MRSLHTALFLGALFSLSACTEPADPTSEAVEIDEPAVEAVATDPGPATLARTPWEMHRGQGALALRTSASTPIAGLFELASIPADGDAGWGSAPNPEVIGFGSDNASELSGCNNEVDYTYFQTHVDIPSNMRMATFEIQFEGMDDASRVTVFNSEYPDGHLVDGSYVRLNGSGTSNLADVVRAGERNRIVVTQVDNCRNGNKLDVARVVLDGQVIETGDDGTITVDGTEIRTGNVQVTLQWNKPVDLDLHVTDPAGDEVSFRNTSVASGGELDVDARRSCAETPETVENILWSGTPPSGEFGVKVNYYTACDEGPVEYTATLRRGGNVVEVWEETVQYGQSNTHTFSVD